MCPPIANPRIFLLSRWHMPARGCALDAPARDAQQTDEGRASSGIWRTTSPWHVRARKLENAGFGGGGMTHSELVSRSLSNGDGLIVSRAANTVDDARLLARPSHRDAGVGWTETETRSMET